MTVDFCLKNSEIMFTGDYLLALFDKKYDRKISYTDRNAKVTGFFFH